MVNVPYTTVKLMNILWYFKCIDVHTKKHTFAWILKQNLQNVQGTVFKE